MTSNIRKVSLRSFFISFLLVVREVFSIPELLKQSVEVVCEMLLKLIIYSRVVCFHLFSIVDGKPKSNIMAFVSVCDGVVSHVVVFIFVAASGLNPKSKHSTLQAKFSRLKNLYVCMLKLTEIFAGGSQNAQRELKECGCVRGNLCSGHVSRTNLQSMLHNEYASVKFL